ncbi:MAG: tRNA (N(6)-L-threonylcarbamoyladenosine(37)-C(2))-methylthiotransferase MtaB [Candidatus Omnitrophica bacterium]|nr:tRNA (N(6)-L-threonylcarbamoyladenosine(37)-C(2))-methylthiotransferase MtaB [Candidatus Omnitrophota bacterium]
MQTCRFDTLGCKVNQYDTQVMRQALGSLGVKEAQPGEVPDLIVLNTCTVTETSDSKSRYLIRRLARENPQARIVVTGCYVEADRAAVASLPQVSACLGVKEEGQLASLVERWREEDGTTGSACTDMAHDLKMSPHSIQEFSGRTRAYLKVMDGCNYRCSFCKVRIVRGNARSRPFKELTAEAEALVGSGHREIVLVGIQLGYYGRDLVPARDLADLVDALEEVPGLDRIRLSSIEPKDITERLIQRLARRSRLCAHVHMPWQSGSDRVLTRMRRSYRRQDLEHITRSLRSQVPDIGIATDIMVGFPGEGEDEFLETLGLVEELSPSRVHIFPYSDRRGTDAASFSDKVEPAEKKRLVERLKEAAARGERAFHHSLLGQSVRVLMEGACGGEGWQEGFTDNYVRVRVSSGIPLENRLAQVAVTHAAEGHIFGNLLSFD